MNSLTRINRHIIGVLILLSYTGIAIFGLFEIRGMSSMNTMHNCPYTIDQHSVCPMDALHHLQTWQSFSMAIISFPAALFLLALFVSGYVWYVLFKSKFSSYDKQYSGYFSPPLYQLLFSQGILNPKAP